MSGTTTHQSKPLVFVPGFPVVGQAGRCHRTGAVSQAGSSLQHQPRCAPWRWPSYWGPDDLTVADGVAAGEPVRSISSALALPFIDLVGAIKRAQSRYDILAKLGYDHLSPPYGDRLIASI